MKKDEKLVDVEPVRLPSFGPLRPGKYILIFLITVILLAVFLLFFLPGIVKGGRYVTFTSSMSSVGVVIDGEYIGSTSGTNYFIESGSHEAEYIKNGITVRKETLEIDHPVFATLFIRRTQTVDIVPTQTDGLYESVFDNTLEGVVSYSAVLSYDETYNYPPLYTSYARDVSAIGIRDVSSDFHLLSSFVTTGEMLDDLKAAAAILDENGVKYSTADLTVLDSLISGNGENTDCTLLSPSGNAHYTSDGFYSYSGESFTMGVNGKVSIETMNTLPVTVITSDFDLAQFYVTEYEYALFTKENPYWAKDNLETLIADGMADEYYLAGITLSTAYVSNLPVRNISWYAADAYCRWLSEKTGTEYRMPSEAEWYQAASSAEGRAYASSILSLDNGSHTSPLSMLGGLWEFTSSAYVPLSRIDGMTYDAGDLSQSDIIVKGGSYINDPSDISRETVGVMRREVCSDYTGLRLVRENI